MTDDTDRGSAPTDRDADPDAVRVDADPDPDHGSDPDPDPDVDADAVLDRVGFDAETSVLTRRQAEVLALRERGLSQTTIADRLGTSRANVSGVERSARENVRKSRETVAFVDALDAPVRVEVSAGTDLYDVPGTVYAACDDAGVKVSYTAPDLMKLVSDAAGSAVEGRAVKTDLLVSVSVDGAVNVRKQRSG